jgi:hypothetical protein
VTTLDPDAASEFVRREWADVVAHVDSCADAVATSWDGTAVDDATAVSAPLEGCLDETGVLEELPNVLAGAVDAAGAELQAPPVAAPPYVVVTSRGPMLRATLDAQRFVVRFDAFRVTEDGHYERAETTVRATVA